jgi:hypothetical protein
MTSEQALRVKLHDTALQLQILEQQKGWHYMMDSRLNQEYEALQEQYEKITEDRATR